MNRYEVNAIMQDNEGWENASPAMRNMFYRECQEIQYGREELHNAWYWFACGWWNHLEFYGNHHDRGQ